MRRAIYLSRARLAAGLPAAVAALLLTGGSPSAPTPDNAANDAAASEVANAADHDAPANPDAAANDSAGADVSVTRYSCEDGRAVVARYINSGVINAMVDLDIAGVKRQATQGVSASGARYATDNGLTKGKTLVWWSKGDGAMLIESDPGDKDGANDKIVNCDGTAEAD